MSRSNILKICLIVRTSNYVFHFLSEGIHIRYDDCLWSVEYNDISDHQNDVLACLWCEDNKVIDHQYDLGVAGQGQIYFKSVL